LIEPGVAVNLVRETEPNSVLENHILRQKTISEKTKVSSEIALPDDLRDRLEFNKKQAREIGRLGNHIIRVTDKATGPAYLKVGSGTAGQDLLDECDRLDWIGDRLPVPRVLFREAREGWTYVLISGLPGRPSHEAFDAVSVPTTIEKLAEGLRRIHAISIDDCPFNRVVENDLEESARRVGLPGLDTDAFIADTGVEPEKLLDQLAAQAPSMDSEFVFTHGDYCFPNLLLDGREISGIVDWGIAGICDINRDFMSIELTVKRNCGAEWIPSFYEAYGPVEPDPERIRFFWLLDRFFSHYSDPPAVDRLTVKP
jgi:aminoglycoside phosphotransferase